MTNASPNPARSALREFASWTTGPVVSIFLPQDPNRPDLDPLQLKAAVQWANDQRLLLTVQSRDQRSLVVLAADPRTGATVKRPASKTARFRVGEGLKNALN